MPKFCNYVNIILDVYPIYESVGFNELYTIELPISGNHQYKDPL